LALFEIGFIFIFHAEYYTGFLSDFEFWLKSLILGTKTPKHIPKRIPHAGKEIRGLTAHQNQPADHQHLHDL